MRLVDLFPRWIHPSMFMFLCPHCRAVFLTCKDVVMGHDAQWALFDPLYDEYPGIVIVGCKESYCWTFSSRDFDTMSVVASLNAEGAGHWHGSITAGAIA